MKIKFNLNFGGEQIRTLADLRENFSIEDVLDNYNNGTLARWLDSRSYNNELEQVKAITATDTPEGTSARGILAELIRIFGAASDPAEIEADLSLIDYLEGRKKFWEDIKANGLDGMDTVRALKQERDGLKQELENVKRGQQKTQWRLEATEQERDTLRRELENAQRGQQKTQWRLEATEQECDALRRNRVKGIKIKFPISTLELGKWRRLSRQGKIFRITGPGNAGSLTVTDDKGIQKMRIQEAFNRNIRLDGLGVLPDERTCYLNRTEPLYFYYDEVSKRRLK